MQRVELINPPGLTLSLFQFTRVSVDCNTFSPLKAPHNELGFWLKNIKFLSSTHTDGASDLSRGVKRPSRQREGDLAQSGTGLSNELRNNLHE